MTTQAHAPRRSRHINLGDLLGTVAKYAFLIAVALLCIVPFVWVWSSALKTGGEIAAAPLALPRNPTLENFPEAWVQGRLGKYFLNSVIVSLPIVLFTVVLSSLAGYAFARHTFTGRNILFYTFLIGLTLPFQSIMIPLYYTLRDVGLLGTYWAMIIPTTALGLPFGIFIMRAFSRGCPRSWTTPRGWMGVRSLACSGASSCHWRRRGWSPWASSASWGPGTRSCCRSSICSARVYARLSSG